MPQFRRGCVRHAPVKLCEAHVLATEPERGIVRYYKGSPPAQLSARYLRPRENDGARTSDRAAHVGGE
ncbi:hypothetical protein BRAS3843_230033 [Bradyrhizobium sp. STM 3843]|nr:hypothetical protein BRAS3843_230033 [Bradyrhizobium sp. STM 3843]